MLPCRSPSTWISTCRGRRIAFSRYTVASPKLRSASLRARSRRPRAPRACDEAHALATAPRRGLEQHRVPHALCGREGFFHRGSAAAGGDGHARGGHFFARCGLRAHGRHGARRRADEGDPRALARLGQGAVLREESRTPGGCRRRPRVSRRRSAGRCGGSSPRRGRARWDRPRRRRARGGPSDRRRCRRRRTRSPAPGACG
jgi:hypothetical protein